VPWNLNVAAKNSKIGFVVIQYASAAVLLTGCLKLPYDGWCW